MGHPDISHNVQLFDDRSHTTGSNSSAALTDSEGKTLLHSDRMDQLDAHLYVIAGHAHLSAFRKVADTGNVGSSEVELRTVVVEERSMTAAFILGQDVYLSGKLVMALYGAGLAKALASLDLRPLNATKQSTNVITSAGLV